MRAEKMCEPEFYIRKFLQDENSKVKLKKRETKECQK